MPFRATPSPAPRPPPSLAPWPTPGAALAAQARTRGLAPALAFPGTGARLGFAQWDTAATALARALAGLGLGPGDRIALLAENRIEWPVVQLAVARLGAVLVPLNSHYRRHDLAHALGQSEARAIVLSPRFRNNPYLETLRALRPTLPALKIVIAFEDAGEDCHDYAALLAQGAADTGDLPEVAPDDVAALLYTSGTTGVPKGALLTHQAMLANSWGAARRGAWPSERPTVGPRSSRCSTVPAAL